MEDVGRLPRGWDRETADAIASQFKMIIYWSSLKGCHWKYFITKQDHFLQWNPSEIYVRAVFKQTRSFLFKWPIYIWMFQEYLHNFCMAVYIKLDNNLLSNNNGLKSRQSRFLIGCSFQNNYCTLN